MNGPLDSGGGFCKISMSVEKCKSTDIGNEEPPQKKRKKSGFKATGAKGCFVIGIVQELPETYGNIKTLVKDELGIEKLSWFKICLDNKAKRLSLGMQSSSSKYSCSYCLGSAPFDNPNEMILRTFGMLKEHARGYLDLVAKIGPEKAKKRAQEFFSQVGYPIFFGEDHEFVLDLVDLSELHLMIGIINKLFDELYKACNEDMSNGECHASVYDWAERKNIVPAKYHGGKEKQSQGTVD
jgi:hypothetical protein